MDIDITGATVIEVRHATSAGDFLPFTALPQAYHGRRVALVILTPEIEAAINQQTDGAGDTLFVGARA